MTPKLIKVKIHFKSNRIDDVSAAVDSEFKKKFPKIKKGARIGIACGSRGISNLQEIVKRTVENVKKSGGEPFIIPAMGSHGGARADGQKKVLESLGITEKQVGASVVSSMEVIELKNDGLPVRVYFSKDAWKSDGTILINRIKPHTDFHSSHESGLVKMSVIGLGKHEGALEIHSFGVCGLKNHMPNAAKVIMESGKIIMGLALVENSFDETAVVKALSADEILSYEPSLLQIARKNMPCLPSNEIDLLVVKNQGKDISGTGMDPNIIGRMKIRDVPEPTSPCIKSIIVTDITDGSHGNAVGVGFADVITKKLFDKIDFQATYENVITSTFLERGKIPIVADNPQKACETAIRSLGEFDPDKIRIVYIKDTLHLSEIYVSKAVYEDIKDEVTTISDYAEIFTKSGELINI
ncbi:MAG: hypothetical protein KAQ98_04760 [Bacteriovoracaceae bacterium]|nr:hypothetical protein [Bacteriovoracaceae bacterium]